MREEALAEEEAEEEAEDQTETDMEMPEGAAVAGCPLPRLSSATQKA
jgi:hypothetical protein